MAATDSSAIRVPAASISVTDAVSRAADEDSAQQRERVRTYVARMRVEHGVEPDPELLDRLRAGTAKCEEASRS
jgi:hypothetical protein